MVTFVEIFRFVVSEMDADQRDVFLTVMNCKDKKEHPTFEFFRYVVSKIPASPAKFTYVKDKLGNVTELKDLVKEASCVESATEQKKLWKRWFEMYSQDESSFRVYGRRSEFRPNKDYKLFG